MDGVLNINKPSGMTSHDVVASVRRTLHEKRIGHTGTLDPLATGVLVLCVGKATRIARFLEAGEKEYRAVMHLGVTTDTLDADGRVIERKSYSPPGFAQIADVAKRFTGTILQRPPAYSAIKIGGVPSYKLARQGKAGLLSPRPVTIHSIEIVRYADPLVHLTVRCSKGVYIRTLCSDVGSALGMGAHLTQLERTRSGSFRIEQAVTPDQLLSNETAGNAAQGMISIDDALSTFPSYRINEDDAARVLHGNLIRCAEPPAVDGSSLIRLHDASGRLLALARVEEGGIKPDLVFYGTDV